ARATSLDSLRGIEGDAAAMYFSVFPHLFTDHDPEVTMSGCSRPPPLDPVNALLSFLYVLLVHDCRSALESFGLDAQCGFLHRDRPGRPSLALDLMEEFRAYFADRLALTLFNRRQITAKVFDYKENGAVLLKDTSSKEVLVTYHVATTTREGQRRLRHVAKACLDYGQRVQNFVFECEVDPARLATMNARLLGIVDLKTDSLRFYHLGSNWHHRVEHHGGREGYDIDGPLIC
ncbi:MAG TPA: CRISPR-associated endonuclease Cas1, partial [Verrucomicrobiales bacterium]|nr:CRISPR-associated endonuclease Cas1 [Verrucomicrobiales bacterium]